MSEIALIIALVTALLAGGLGFKLGVDHQVAAEVGKIELVAEAVDAASNAAALAIANLAPRYTTIQNKVQHEIETHTVYADCRLSPDGLLLANQALGGGGTKAVADGKLPSAGSTGK